MISDQDRQKLIEAIEAYVSERVKSFEFDDMLDPLRDSKDATVRKIAFDCWYYYDDIVDHKIHGPAEVWDIFQRYLLVLRAGLDTQAEHRYRWGLVEACAASLVGVFIATFIIALCWGAWGGVFVLWILLGIASIPIGICKERVVRSEIGGSEAFPPFSSEAEMRHAMATYPEFTMAPCPEHIDRRKLRSAVTVFVMGLPWRLIQICLGPAFLVWQSLPYRHTISRVIQSPE